MKPLFPDKDKLELKEDTSKDKDKRKQYKINPDCRYFGPQQYPTGRQTVDGDLYDVPADTGTMVKVWVANDQTLAEDLRYFCHGHSFGTYKKYGYSIPDVYSYVLEEWDLLGPRLDVDRTAGIKVTIKPEDYQKVKEVSLTGRGLVAICFDAPPAWVGVIGYDWVKRAASAAGLDTSAKVIHSFRLVEVSDKLETFLDSQVSSKNTFSHLELNTSIKKQLEMFTAIASFRVVQSKAENWKQTNPV